MSQSGNLDQQILLPWVVIVADKNVLELVERDISEVVVLSVLLCDRVKFWKYKIYSTSSSYVRKRSASVHPYSLNQLRYDMLYRQFPYGNQVSLYFRINPLYYLNRFFLNSRSKERMKKNHIHLEKIPLIVRLPYRMKMSYLKWKRTMPHGRKKRKLHF